jgi:5-methylcytosine-specific restriction endonuclease McrA
MCAIEKLMCRNYYLMARELTEQTGVNHEVDHIWPISKGGPHLPWNLQVLTQEENRKKRDKI